MLLPNGDVGMGEVALALIPTLNTVVLAVIYKLLGKTKQQLEANEANITTSKHELRADLKNGVKDRLDSIDEKLETKEGKE